MAINFAAADMAGYNNPKIYMFPVTIKLGGGSPVVDGAPSYSTLTNIIKSGYIPVIFAAAPAGGLLLPLTAILTDGSCQFSAPVYPTPGNDSKVLFAVVISNAGADPIFLSAPI